MLMNTDWKKMDCASYFFFYQEGGVRVVIVDSNKMLEILLRGECLCDNLSSPPLTTCTVKDTLWFVQVLQ